MREIDTQSPLYYEFLKLKRKRADYFFKDEKGIAAYKILKRFSKHKDPILDYYGCHICDHLPADSCLPPDLWQECVRVYTNKVARSKRLVKRLREFNGWCYFVTLTFTDEQLKMSPESRRHNLINPFLKLMREKYGCVGYVGVKEYGKKTDREHYHFVMCFKDKLHGEIGVSMKWDKPREYLKNSEIEQNWNAIVNVRPIIENGFENSVANYLSKVAGYLDKDTNKTQHLIYSSGFKAEIKLPKFETDEDGFFSCSDEDLEAFDLLFGV